MRNFEICRTLYANALSFTALRQAFVVMFNHWWPLRMFWKKRFDISGKSWKEIFLYKSLGTLPMKISCSSAQSSALWT